MGRFYLIVGNVGAGKSTYAADLAVREQAHIFTVDEWMVTLFLEDAPDPIEYDWALERTERIERQILSEAVKLARLDLSIILDLGFFSRDQRDRVQASLLDQGFAVDVHYLDVDRETRWQRVHQRNQEQGETFRFEVSREIFDFCETIFEPLDKQELATATVISP